MGGNSDVLKYYWHESFPDSVVITKEVPHLLLPNPRPERRRFWICDIAGWMFLTWSPHTSLRRTDTFGRWLEDSRARIQHYLEDHSVTRVVVLLDCYSDPAKRVLRPRNQKAGKPVPATPPEGWRQYLVEQTYRFDDRFTGSLPQSVDTPMQDIDINLPGFAPGCEFKFEDYLANSDFKNHFFIPLICRNLLIGMRVPRNKEVILRGPNTAAVLRDGVISDLPTALAIQYGEADAIVGFWAAKYLDEDVLVDSPDFDVITNLLLTSSKRCMENRSSGPELKSDNIFRNRVCVVRNQVRRDQSNTVVHINELHKGMYLLGSGFHAEGIASIRNPVGDQVLLAYLSGKHDYVDSALLPKVGITTLFRTYFVYARTFPKGLVKEHIKDHKFVGFYVDPWAFYTFVIYCYKIVYPKLELDPELPEDCFEKIHQRLLQAGVQRSPNMDTVRQLCLNITWSMSYYANGCYGRPVPRSTELFDGMSKYGWKPDGLDKRNVLATSEVNINWLFDLVHPDLKPKEPPSPVSTLRAPRPDNYNQLDPIL